MGALALPFHVTLCRLIESSATFAIGVRNWRFAWLPPASVSQTTKNIMDYNSSGIQSGDKTLIGYSYNALGQVKTKNIGQNYTYPLQPVEAQNYEYNIRGWLLGVNRDYVKGVTSTSNFGFDLAYDKADNNINGESYTSLSGYTHAFYNGNIAGMTWRGETNGAAVRRYDYVYDAANRFLKADFKDLTDSSHNTAFDVKMGDGINADQAYDYNGNIKAMQQYGLYQGGIQLIDNLTYVYKEGGLSNKLARVSDERIADYQLGDFKNGSNTDDDYDYDINGNLTKDQNKGISSISYNILNLPEQIVVDGKGTITYQYDAEGIKLTKTVNATGQTPKTTQYVGDMIFEGNILQHVATEEGRVRLVSGQWRFDYFLKDHLGNVRVLLADNGTPLEETHYYPFGLQQKGISIQNATASLANKKKYQGYEQNTDLDLNLYETFYRSHDPQIGRFLQIDPKPSDYESPYVAMGNNPILNFDLLGDTTYRFNKSTGAYIGMFDLDATGQVGSYGEMRTIGKGKNKQEIWNGTRFEFADLENDAQQIRDGL